VDSRGGDRGQGHGWDLPEAISHKAVSGQCTSRRQTSHLIDSRPTPVAGRAATIVPRVQPAQNGRPLGILATRPKSLCFLLNSFSRERLYTSGCGANGVELFAFPPIV
jgi:hypothetical protein